jgi:uncharacterized protein involved in response to NO
MRAWTGPAILTFVFRPFIFGAAVWAVLAMVLWLPMITGHMMLPSAESRATQRTPSSWLRCRERC